MACNIIEIARAVAEKKRIRDVDWDNSQAKIDNANLLKITLAHTDKNKQHATIEIDLKNKNNETKEILELSAKLISDELRDDFEKLRKIEQILDED